MNRNELMKKLTIPKISVESVRLWINSIERKTLIQNATIGGAFLFFVLFLFFPMLIHNKKVAGEAANLKTKVTQANFKIARIPEMMKQKKLFGERIKKIREQFFAADEADKLIEITSTIAAESGVKIDATRPAVKILEVPTPFTQTYVPISYEFAVEGAYHNLGTFVNSLEQYSKNFAVHELKITAGDNLSRTQQSILIITAFIKRAQTS